MKTLIKKYWFVIALFLIFCITVADTTETVSNTGRWFKSHRGPDAVIFIIFFVSGLILNAAQIKAGLKDIQGILIAFALIFFAAPLIAALSGLTSLDPGIKIGIFLIAVMPSTLSSGVVMTGAAGGNMAHALVITVMANVLAVFSIPVLLAFLLNIIGSETTVFIDRPAIMLKIGLYVIVPLCIGFVTKVFAKSFVDRFDLKLGIINQSFVLIMVWMALSQSRNSILNGGGKIGTILLTVILFHGILLIVAGLLVWIFKVGKGRRESIIFMGGQKTLPLSVILQVSLFPQYGLALVVCVTHHIIHLMMDGCLTAKLAALGFTQK